MTQAINYLINPTIVWTCKHDGLASTASGTWRDWEFSISHNGRGGWNVKVNGIQAWTHMRGFLSAMASVKDRLRDWAYMDQFKGAKP